MKRIKPGDIVIAKHAWRAKDSYVFIACKMGKLNFMYSFSYYDNSYQTSKWNIENLNDNLDVWEEFSYKVNVI